jgi:hypothetical protein
MRAALLPLLALLPLVAGCASGKGSTEGEVDSGGPAAPTSPEDIAELCDQGEPQVLARTLSFPATERGCDWGEGGNLDRDDAHVSAREEQLAALALPEGAVICDMAFDFAGVNGGEGTPMEYDDNFFLAFNDVVLAASYKPLVDVLPVEDELYRVYSWGALAGQPFEFNDTTSYCLGEDEGLASCDVPPPETRGLLQMAFAPEVANQLAFRAIAEGRAEFNFITIGDNDDTDCFHEEFAFEVEVPFVTAL